MPLLIVRNDITKMDCDAIVNAAKNSLLGGGGVDGCIHRAAGPALLEECRTLGGCPTGEAKITGAYELPSRYVIHTVGPVWQDGLHGEEALLRSCYRNSLALARKHQCESVAFPLISAGIYGCPKEIALRIATEEIGAFLLSGEDMTVYLVVFGRGTLEVGQKLHAEIREYIDDNYVSAHTESFFERRRNERIDYDDALASLSVDYCLAPAPMPKAKKQREEKRADELAEALSRIDESFSQMLLRKITEKGMTDAECYKKANIDRKHFSKIRSDIHYQPKKRTALAFAVALELNMKDTRELLEKAGFALTHANKADIIIEYFIRHGNYNIFEINNCLFAEDQELLGQ